MSKNNLDDLIKVASEVVEDASYRITKVKSPRSIRSVRNNLEFWTSILQHLRKLRRVQKEITGPGIDSQVKNTLLGILNAADTLIEE